MKKSIVFGYAMIALLYLALKSASVSSYAEVEIRNTANMLQISSGPIRITHDDNFTYYGFEGTGSETNPFIIEDLSIVTVSDYGIYVTATTKHFVIRHCNVDARECGIYISDTIDGSANVTNNICNDNDIGIRVVEIADAIITNNECNNKIAGIHVENSVRVNVTFNECKNNDYHGIFVFSSQDCILINNTCNSNIDSGLMLDSSTSNDIYNNTFANNNINGIYLYASWKNSIINNTIANNNREGIKIYNSDQCTIIRNLLSGNNLYGVKFELGSDNNIVHHNTFYHNNIGGTSQASDVGSNNAFYEEATSEGNWWSDWSDSPHYSIDGSAGSIDPFPLGEPVVPIYEFSINNISIGIAFLGLMFFVILYRKRDITVIIFK